MRWLLFVVSLVAGGYAGYLGTFGKSSYAGYSSAQLDQLEAEHSRLLQRSGAEEAEQHRFSLRLLQQERQRVVHFFGALGVAGLALVAAFLLPGSRRVSSRGLRDEEARFLKVMGNPEVARQGARHKAAELLGVSPDAQPPLIEAALQARLAERDPARMEGLAPDLRRVALEQREALQRAANLLLGRQG